jgi:hypothetical protein
LVSCSSYFCLKTNRLFIVFVGEKTPGTPPNKSLG